MVNINKRKMSGPGQFQRSLVMPDLITASQNPAMMLGVTSEFPYIASTDT